MYLLYKQLAAKFTWIMDTVVGLLLVGILKQLFWCNSLSDYHLSNEKAVHHSYNWK